MNPKNREQLLAILAVTAIVLMLGDKFILQPLSTSWNARNKRIADLEKQVAEGTAKLERDRAIRDRWNAMRANSLTNDVSAAETRALGAFDRWSREARVTISSLKPTWKRTTEREEHQTIEYHADVTGSLANLAQFLYQIEKDPLAMKVDSVELATRDVEGRNLTLSLQLSGLVLNPKKNENGAK